MLATSPAIARFDLFEFSLTVVTLLTVALVGVEQGIAVAVGLAVVDRSGSAPALSCTFSAAFPEQPAGRR